MAAEVEGNFNCFPNIIPFALFPPFCSSNVAIIDGIILLGPVKVLICADGTSRWRSNATRCDVFVDCRQRSDVLLSGASSPSRWGTWWALDGNDTRDTLTTLGHFNQNYWVYEFLVVVQPMLQPT